MSAKTHSLGSDWSRVIGRLFLAASLTTLGLTGLAGRAEAETWRAGDGTASASSAPNAGRSCEEQADRNRRRGRGIGAALGGIAGVAGALGGRTRRVAGLVTTLVPVGALLGEAIAGLLDCDEQQRAASATETALSGGVGTTTNWTSATRPGVTGSSTVTAAERTADGNACMTVTDVVIVDGEETRAPKRMCRQPPSNRYARV